MELRDYLAIARQRWLLIVGAVAVVVAVAALYTATATRQYQSTASVFVSTTPSSTSEAYNGGLFSQQRVTSYADLVTGADMARKVIDQLGLNTSPAGLAGKVKATVVPETVVLTITVTDASPKAAQRINQGYVQVLQDSVKELETPPGGTTPLLKATVVDSPTLPGAPISPKPVRNLGLALVLGLLLGMGLAVLREVLDSSVREPADVPTLEGVPMLSGLAYDDDVHEHPLISTLPTHAPRVESFRVLRTNLSFVDVDNTSKAFVVTSSVPNEGKSTTAVNTALAMAAGGQRVLLLDGDLRRPQVANLLGLEGSVGLTSVLVGKITLPEAVQQHSPSSLDVLTAGALPPNPAELIQSRAMRDLLAEVRTRYDVVVIDSPPLLPVTDAALIAAETDGAVLVIRHGKTTKEQVAGAVERLHAVDTVPLGVIMNMVPSGRGGRYGRYGYGYGYGYAPRENDSREQLPRATADKAAANGAPVEPDRSSQPSERREQVGRFGRRA